MLNCRQVTRLVSQSLNAKLSWHQRLAMRFHLLYCVWCRRYAEQVRFLRQATKTLAAKTETAAPQSLSPAAKEQIRARLQAALRDTPPPA